MPTVSVVIPLFNGQQYIENCLRSVFSQRYEDYEVIVVDDGSSDDGPKKILALAKTHPEKVRLLRHEDRGNHGIAATRNLGIKNARGEFIAFLDQDDLWVSEKLQKQVAMLRCHPEAGLVYSKISFVDQDGGDCSANSFPSAGKGIVGHPAYIFPAIIKENFIPSITVLARRECVQKVGLFDDGLRHGFEDWILWSKMAYFYGFIFLDQVLAKRRLHSGSFSSLRRDIGLHLSAEENYIRVLFSHLLDQKDIHPSEVRSHLRKCIWRFFIKARSWGATTQQVSSYASSLSAAFPSEERMIARMMTLVPLINTGVAGTLRRLRRRVVGI